jgi:putative ABC transport system permease protein
MRGVRHPLWGKAPTRLVRHPAMLAAVALGAMLVTVVCTAYPLFLSASDSGILASTIALPNITRYGAGLGYRSTNVPFDASAPDGGSLAQERHDEFASIAAADPGFGPTADSRLAPTLIVSVPDTPASAGSAPARLFTGTDVLDHVQIVSGTDGDGVWLPDILAARLQVQPGDTIRLDGGSGTAEVAVDGTYVALSGQTSDGYWQIWRDQFLERCLDCSPPPPFILADPAQLIDLQTQLKVPMSDQAFLAPLREAPDLTLDDLRAVAASVADVESDMSSQATHLGRMFPCCGPRTTVAGLQYATQVVSQTAGVVGIVEGRSLGLRGPAVVLLLAGLAIAFVVVCAAGVFSFSSRPTESALLSVRGWGPLRVAAKAALESALPVVAGAVAGFWIAYALVLLIGPDGAIESTARTTAILGSAAAAVAVTLVIGGASAVMFVANHERKARVGRYLLWLPWELLAFAAVIGFGRSLRSGGALVGTGQIQRPGAPVFLYAIAFAAAVGIVVARAATLTIIWRSRSGGGTKVSARWLTLHRLASSIRLSAVFLIAAAIAVSVSVSAQALVSSLRSTVVAKAEIFVGSDVQAEMPPDASPPTDFSYPLTAVLRAPGAVHLDDQVQPSLQLLAIDPATFAKAAFWSDELSDAPLDQMVARLGEDHGGALPIIIANGGDLAPSTMTMDANAVPVDVVGRAVSFPGSSSQSPVIVVSRVAAQRAFPTGFPLLRVGGGSTEFWMKGPTTAVVDAVGRADFTPYSVLTSDEVRDIPFIAAAVNTFLTLDVLGILALLLVVVLAVGYLQVRQRPRVVAARLSSRMGVPSRLLRRALILELGGVLLGAIAVGVPTGLISAAVVVRSLDPLKSIPPPPFFDAPWVWIAVTAAALLVAAVVGGWIVDRATRRADLGEVMRVAG